MKRSEFYFTKSIQVIFERVIWDKQHDILTRTKSMEITTFCMLAIRRQGIGFLVFSSETMLTLQETIPRVCVLFFFDAVV